MKELEKKIGYRFKENTMIERAFTHSSYINEAEDENLKSYERLEYLGDAVLALVISEILFQNYPDMQEGEMSKIRSKIVCENSLYLIANKIDLGSYIKFSKGEEKNGGRNRKSILADVVESMIAVIYLEDSFEAAKKVIMVLFEDVINTTVKTDSVDDYKSLLQMWAQSKKMDIPVYRVVDSSGPEHNKTFKSVVYLDGKILAEGTGKSKRASEQEAAKVAYSKLKM